MASGYSWRAEGGPLEHVATVIMPFPNFHKCQLLVHPLSCCSAQSAAIRGRRTSHHAQSIISAPQPSTTRSHTPILEMPVLETLKTKLQAEPLRYSANTSLVLAFCTFLAFIGWSALHRILHIPTLDSVLPLLPL